MSTFEERIAQLEETIATLKAQRAVLGDTAVETAVASLRQQLSNLRQAATAEPAPSLEGERKLVTVMFADISDFTTLSEKIDAEDVQDLLHRLWPRLGMALEIEKMRDEK
jgi:class 3 adenylate cyclase